MLVLATRQWLCAPERFRKTHLEELEIVVGDALPDTLEGRWGAGAARDGHLGAVATEDEALFFHDPQPLRDQVVCGQYVLATAHETCRPLTLI